MVRAILETAGRAVVEEMRGLEEQPQPADSIQFPQFRGVERFEVTEAVEKEVGWRLIVDQIQGTAERRLRNSLPAEHPQVVMEEIRVQVERHLGNLCTYRLVVREAQVMVDTAAEAPHAAGNLLVRPRVMCLLHEHLLHQRNRARRHKTAGVAAEMAGVGQAVRVVLEGTKGKRNEFHENDIQNGCGGSHGGPFCEFGFQSVC